MQYDYIKLNEENTRSSILQEFNERLDSKLTLQSIKDLYKAYYRLTPDFKSSEWAVEWTELLERFKKIKLTKGCNNLKCSCNPCTCSVCKCGDHCSGKMHHNISKHYKSGVKPKLFISDKVEMKIVPETLDNKFIKSITKLDGHDIIHLKYICKLVKILNKAIERKLYIKVGFLGMPWYRNLQMMELVLTQLVPAIGCRTSDLAFITYDRSTPMGKNLNDLSVKYRKKVCDSRCTEVMLNEGRQRADDIICKESHIIVHLIPIGFHKGQRSTDAYVQAQRAVIKGIYSNKVNMMNVVYLQFIVQDFFIEEQYLEFDVYDNYLKMKSDYIREHLTQYDPVNTERIRPIPPRMGTPMPISIREESNASTSSKSPFTIVPKSSIVKVRTDPFRINNLPAQYIPVLVNPTSSRNTKVKFGFNSPSRNNNRYMPLVPKSLPFAFTFPVKPNPKRREEVSIVPMNKGIVSSSPSKFPEGYSGFTY